MNLKITLLALPLLALAGLSRAQTSNASSATSDKDVVILSPFVVKGEADIGYRATNAMGATKTNTPIQETPQSIQVINQEFIIDQGAISLDDTMRFTSGVSQGTDIRGDRYSMRGYQTGIPSKDAFRDTGRAPREMSNIERVEVVKGPAAFTFGRTTPGGVINMVLKRPQTKRATTLTGVVGSYDYYRATLDTTGPIDSAGHFAYRLIGAWEDSNSFRDDFSVKREFITPSILWQITPSTSLRIESEYLHDERTPNRGLVMLNGRVPDPIPTSNNYQWEGSRIDSTQYNYLVELLHRFNSHISLRAASRYNNTDEFGYVTNVTGVNATTGLLTRSVQRSNDVIIDNRYTQVELLLTGTTFGLEHNVLVGTEIGWNNSDSTVDQASLPAASIYAPNPMLAPGNFNNTSKVNTYSDFKSYYLQDQIFLANHTFAILAGARRDEYKQDATNRRVNPATVTHIHGSFTDPRLGVAWYPSKELTFYAMYASSNVPPTGANPDGRLLKPSVGSIYEAGVKATFLDQRLTSTFALYDVNQDNVGVSDPANPGYKLNVGSRRSIGADLDITYIIANNWTLLASAAYVDGEVTADTTIPVGSPLGNIPDFAATAWMRYDVKSGPLHNFTFGLGYIYSGSTYVDDFGAVKLPSFYRFDGLVRYRWKDLDLSLNLRNLDNHRFYQAAASVYDVQPGIPFTAQLTVRYRF